MELNTKQKTIKYYINNKDYGIAFDQIQFTHSKPYHMVISLCSRNNLIITVQFLQFQQICCS